MGKVELSVKPNDMTGGNLAVSYPGGSRDISRLLHAKYTRISSGEMSHLA